MTTDPRTWTVPAVLSLAPDEKSIPAAREVLKNRALGPVEAGADGRAWSATCRGWGGEYRVTVRRVRDVAACRCTCPSRKQPCKHALALLLHLVDHPELRPEGPARAAHAGDFEMLLRAVFRNPDDDTPRLVLADYLDENDQPDRAQLIRVQCEIARLRPGARGRGELRKVEKELSKRFAGLINPRLVSYRQPPGFVRGFLRLETHWTYLGYEQFAEAFRGGWVEELRLNYLPRPDSYVLDRLRLVGALDLVEAGPDESTLLALAALVGGGESRLARVKLAPRDQKVYEAFRAAHAGATVTDVPASRGLSSRREFHSLTAEQFAVLVGAGRLGGAEELTLEGPIGDAGAARLAAAGGLGRLTALTLSGSRVGPAGAAALAASDSLGGLRRLTLAGRAMDDDAFVELCRRGAFPRLVDLSVAGGLIGDDAAVALGRASHFADLRRTGWDSTLLTAEGVAALVGSANLPQLTAAVLAGNSLPREHWLALLLAGDRPRLEITFPGLHLFRTADPDAAGVAVRVIATGEWGQRRLDELLSGLGRHRAARAVTSLELTRFSLTPSNVRDVAAALAADRLKQLDLTNNHLGNDGAAALATAFGKFKLETLNLARNAIRRSGAEALAASPLLGTLRSLDLSENHVGLGGVNAILASPHLGQLRSLDLTDTGLMAPERRRVAKTAPKWVKL